MSTQWLFFLLDAYEDRGLFYPDSKYSNCWTTLNFSANLTIIREGVEVPQFHYTPDRMIILKLVVSTQRSLSQYLLNESARPTWPNRPKAQPFHYINLDYHLVERSSVLSCMCSSATSSVTTTIGVCDVVGGGEVPSPRTRPGRRPRVWLWQQAN